MIAQAWQRCKTCTVHHIRSTRLRVEVEQGGAGSRAAARSSCRNACARQNTSFWTCDRQVRRSPMCRRPSSAVPVGVPVALPLVVRPTCISPLYRGLCAPDLPLDPRLVLADAGDRVSRLPLWAAAQRPSRHTMRAISRARAERHRISQWCGASTGQERQPAWRERRRDRGRQGTTRESPAPGGAHRPRGGLSSLQRGPLARHCGRAAPGTPTFIMARLWVSWFCPRGVLPLAAPRGTHTARPYACLPGWSAVP